MVREESAEFNGNDSEMDARCAWTKLQLNRLEAGSAENFLDGNPDFADNPS